MDMNLSKLFDIVEDCLEGCGSLGLNETDMT